MPRRIYISPRSGTHKQARQAAYAAGLLLTAGDEDAGPLGATAIASVPWDWDTDTVTLTAGGLGQIILPRAGSVPTGEAWLIHRARVFIAGGRAANPAAIGTLYLGNALDINALDASQNAGEDTAEYPNPLVLNPGQWLTMGIVGGGGAFLARFTIQGEIVLLEA